MGWIGKVHVSYVPGHYLALEVFDELRNLSVPGILGAEIRLELSV